MEERNQQLLSKDSGGGVGIVKSKSSLFKIKRENKRRTNSFTEDLVDKDQFQGIDSVENIGPERDPFESSPVDIWQNQKIIQKINIITFLLIHQ